MQPEINSVRRRNHGSEIRPEEGAEISQPFDVNRQHVNAQTYIADDTMDYGDQPGRSEELQEALHLDERPNKTLDLAALADDAEKIVYQIQNVADCNVDILFKSSVLQMNSCSSHNSKYSYFKFLKNLQNKYSENEVHSFAKQMEEITSKKELQRIIASLLVIFWVKVSWMIRDDSPTDVLNEIELIYRRVLVNKNCLHELNQHFPSNLVVSYIGIWIRWFFLYCYKNSRKCRRIYHKTGWIRRICQSAWLCFFLNITILFILIGIVSFVMNTVLTCDKFFTWWKENYVWLVVCWGNLHAWGSN